MRNNIKKLGFVLLITMGAGIIYAQEKTERLTERYDTSENVTILIDAQNTDVIFEDWNKDEVEIEAILETEGLTEAEIEQLKNAWQIEVQGNSGTIQVRSNGDSGMGLALNEIPMGNLDKIVSSSISMLEPMMRNMITPMMQGLSGNQLPQAYFEKIDSVSFDYEAYRREGEKYLKAYKQQIQSNFGGDFQELMSQLQNENTVGRQKINGAIAGLKGMPKSPFGKNLNFNGNAYEENKKEYIDALNKRFGTKATIKEVDKWLEEMEVWGEDFGESFGKNMEQWGENYGEAMEESMQAWGQNMGAAMENWGAQFGEQMEQMAQNNNGNYSKTVTRDANGNVIGTQMSYSVTGTKPNASLGKVKRTIVVHKPKEAKLDLDVRHGNIKIGEAKNARVNLSHGAFYAKTIDGDRTYLTMAYSPIDVASWNYGTLQTSYVKHCVIDKAENINVDSRTSNIVINEIGSSAIIKGSFGELTIPKLGRDFKTINISLNNSELVLTLPDAPYNFSYNGTRSALHYPKTLEAKVMRGYDSQMLNGYNKKKDAGGSVLISSKFSEIVVK